MIAYVNDASSTITSTWPTGSRRRGRGARDSGTKRIVSASATRPTGMLIQKIERHPSDCTNAPPTTGPSARLTPTVAPHMPIACARSRASVKTLRMIDIATGFSIEPPTACSIRKAISQPRLGAALHSSEPSVNSTSPVWKTRRRPSRSPIDPDSISRLASTSVYASTVHCRPATVACSSRPIDGSATFTIVLSRPTINRLMQQIARISWRRLREGSGVGGAPLRPTATPLGSVLMSLTSGRRARGHASASAQESQSWIWRD